MEIPPPSSGGSGQRFGNQGQKARRPNLSIAGLVPVISIGTGTVLDYRDGQDKPGRDQRETVASLLLLRNSK
jgi:hypothetical protein